MTPGPDADDTGPRRPGSAGLRTVMAVVLGLLLVAAVVAMVWGFTRLASAEERLDDRADAVRVAERFAVAVNNYEAGDIDGYKASVTDLLSTKFRGEYDDAMEDIVAQIDEAEMVSEGEVLASGVATIDDDSARVLVVADAVVQTVYDERQRHFRWEVSLVKVDGEWLVDDFSPVA